MSENLYKIVKKDGETIFQEGSSQSAAMYRAGMNERQVREIKKLNEEQVEMVREWQKRQEQERKRNIE